MCVCPHPSRSNPIYHPLPLSPSCGDDVVFLCVRVCVLFVWSGGVCVDVQDFGLTISPFASFGRGGVLSSVDIYWKTAGVFGGGLSTPDSQTIIIAIFG